MWILSGPWEHLVEGGLFIQGRNVDEVDGELRATVFQCHGGILTPVEDFGGGSELRGFIAGLDADAFGGIRGEG